MTGLLKSKIFLLTTLVPTLASVVYFGVVASDEYVSESKFVVRTPERASPSPFGQLLRSSGFSKTLDDSYVVQEYMLSRDALSLLESDLSYRKVYERNGMDVFNSFPGVLFDDSFETLYRFYLKKTSVDTDNATSITTLTVVAPTPEGARTINQVLLEASERLVNKLNERGRQDALKTAKGEVSEAEEDVKKSAVKLASYRNQSSIIDPERQSAINLQQIAKLEDELVMSKLQLQQVLISAPNNPQIPSLKSRISHLEKNITEEKARVAGSGKSTSLASKSVAYQEVLLDKEIAEKKLMVALASLEAAKSESQKKHIYLERIVEPNAPDFPLLPKRIKGVLTTFFAGLLAWGVLSLVTASVREHME